jgi:hypothetical protein
MIRTIAGVLALCVFAACTSATQGQQPVKNQMVKGTIKEVNVKDSVLVVNQKVGNETVVRQLDIRAVTTFVVNTGTEKKEASGKDGLSLLEGKEGSSVQVKCDKDVNVVSVSVTLKK